MYFLGYNKNQEPFTNNTSMEWTSCQLTEYAKKNNLAKTITWPRNLSYFADGHDTQKQLIIVEKGMSGVRITL